MGDDFPVDELTDEVEIIFEDDEDDADEDGGSPPAAEEAVAEPAPSELERVQAELAELRESYLRKLAEFDNFRKRTEREKDELRRTAGDDLVRELVPVLDNFDRALVHAGEPSADESAFRTGVEMIAKQLRETLARLGLEEIDPEGEVFDPEWHEAVHRVEDGDHAPGTVAAVLGKGYRFGGKLVRPAMVSVVVQPAPPAPTEAPEGEDAP